MKFQITVLEPLTAKSGTKFARASVKNEQGQEFSNVTLFSPQCDTAIGGFITGELTPNDYNGKTGWKFKAETTTTNFQKKASNFVANTEKAQAVVSANVEKAQESKQTAIKLSSDQRDAVLLVTTFYKDSFKLHTDQEMEISVKSKILEWQKWLKSNVGVDLPF